MRQDLPPLDLVLTPNERSKAAAATVYLEDRRRRQNERDRRAARESDAQLLARALGEDEL